jgi:hypothetical protein
MDKDLLQKKIAQIFFKDNYLENDYREDQNGDWKMTLNWISDSTL